MVASGAGVRVKFGRVSAEGLRAAIHLVLTEPDPRAAAARVQASFAEAGGAPAAAGHLERLAGVVRQRRPVTARRRRRVRGGHVDLITDAGADMASAAVRRAASAALDDDVELAEPPEALAGAFGRGAYACRLGDGMPPPGGTPPWWCA